MADYETKDGIGGTPAPSGSEFEYTSEWLRENTQIHGWLTFFLIVMMIGGVVSVVMRVIDVSDKLVYSNGWLVVSDIVFAVEMLAVAIYSVYLFAARKRSAVFFAKVYVVVVLLTNVMGLISGADYYDHASRMVSSVIWSCIWFTYLTLSDQVGEIIPKPFRKVSKIDIALVCSVILIPIILLVIGVFSYAVTNYVSDTEGEFSKIPVLENERNDGRVIFKIPDGFTCECEEVDVEGYTMPVYYISREDGCSVTVCSSYEFDTSISNFEEYVEAWRAEDEAPIHDVEQSTTYVNKRECYYKITTYEVDDFYIYWRFYFLSDEKSGKVFIASFYDYGEDIGYVGELLYSVKFEKPQ